MKTFFAILLGHLFSLALVVLFMIVGHLLTEEYYKTSCMQNESIIIDDHKFRCYEVKSL